MSTTTRIDYTETVAGMAEVAREVWGAPAASVVFAVRNGGLAFDGVYFSRGYGWEKSTPVVHYPKNADSAARDAAAAWATGEAVDAANELTGLADTLLALVADEVAAHRARESRLAEAAATEGRAHRARPYRSQTFITDEGAPYLVEIDADGALTIEF